MKIMPFNALPNVVLITTHGRITIVPQGPKETLFELLNRSGVPWSAISAFSSGQKGELTSISSLNTSFSELRGCSEVHLHFNRNINPELFNIENYNLAPAMQGAEVSSYLYQTIDNNKGTTDHILKGLSQAECQELLKKHVHSFLRDNFSSGESFVIGISGGGDSNAMLLGMTSFKDFEVTIQPVILKGVADWDAGVPRAQALCDEYGLKLRVVDEAEVKSICGVQTEKDLIQQYESCFPGDDFEFLGTYLIRKVLSHIAATENATVCTGLNFEDILAECLFRLCSGEAPLPFPVRQLNAHKFAYPLWMSPKKIIDGCFPKLSIDNYEMRYPCFSVGRNLYYMMAYTIQSKFPGTAERLVKGMQNITNNNPGRIFDDEAFGSTLSEDIQKDLVDKFSRLLSS